ncbi:MAG: VanZ family protein [Polaromonas sp.]|nr:VanZ family protein [Polaromonas sp.]
MLQVLKRTMPYAFSMALVVTTVLLLIPSYAVPKAFDFYDKAQHALVFMSLTVVGLMAFPTFESRVYWPYVYGGVMEVLQSLLTKTRHGDVVDWVADIIGIVLGLCVYWVLIKFRKNAFNKIATE